MKLSAHFNSAEFACKCKLRGFIGEEFCGGSSKIDQRLVEVLEQLIADLTTDTMMRVRCVITSGYRCPAYNKAVDGAPNSQHCQGIAADIKVLYHSGEEMSPRIVADYLEEKYPNKFGIGRYPRWTHIDVRSVRARWGSNKAGG